MRRGDACKKCGRRIVLSWHVSDIIWEEVVGDPYAIWCLTCFDEEAEKQDIRYLLQGQPEVLTWFSWDDENKVRERMEMGSHWWNSHLDLIKRSIDRSRDPNISFKWTQLVWQECRYWLQMGRVDRDEFDSICRIRGFNRTQRNFIAGLLKFAGVKIEEKSLREKIKTVLKERQDDRKASEKKFKPRYDDVYWKGVEVLDKMAHDEE